MLNEDILNDLNELDSPEELQPIEEEVVDSLTTSQLLKSSEFLEHMRVVEGLVDSKIESKNLKISGSEHSLIKKCNAYASRIDQEVNGLFRNAKQIYHHKFPELESIVTSAPSYCRALRDIELFENAGQNKDIQSLQFSYLSPHQSISLRIALSSPHPLLPLEEVKLLHSLSETVMMLCSHRELLLMYLQSCMRMVAPSLCQLVGSQTASKLIALAGGIDKLALMPACNIQVMGGKRSSQVGFGMIERNHTGVFGEMDVVKDAPRNYQMQLVRMLATNTAKCARSDYLNTNSIDGNQLRLDMYERFDKIQEQGGLLREEKPFPIPGEQPKKKRGGKRFRKTKELYEMSELMKSKNRVKFGQDAEEEIEDGVGIGMLKSGGVGKLNVPIKKQKLNVGKKMQARMQKKSGLESSLNLGASTGIELINPQLINEKKRESGKETYFSKNSGFKTVLNSKFGNMNQ